MVYLHFSLNICHKTDMTYIQFSSIQSLSHVQLFVTLWNAARQASPSITDSQSLLKYISIELVMPIQPCHPLLSPSPSAFNLSQHQFSSVSQSWPILCNPMNFRTSSLPDHHQFPEFTQTHGH